MFHAIVHQGRRGNSRRCHAPVREPAAELVGLLGVAGIMPPKETLRPPPCFLPLRLPMLHSAAGPDAEIDTHPRGCLAAQSVSKEYSVRAVNRERSVTNGTLPAAAWSMPPTCCGQAGSCDPLHARRTTLHSATRTTSKSSDCHSPRHSLCPSVCWSNPCSIQHARCAPCDGSGLCRRPTWYVHQPLPHHIARPRL